MCIRDRAQGSHHDGHGAQGVKHRLPAIGGRKAHANAAENPQIGQQTARQQAVHCLLYTSYSVYMSKYYRNFLPVCQGDGPALRQRTGFFPGKSQGSPGFPPGKGPLPAGRTGPSLLHGLNGRLQLFVLLGLQLPGQQLLLILLRQGAQEMCIRDRSQPAPPSGQSGP